MFVDVLLIRKQMCPIPLLDGILEGLAVCEKVAGYCKPGFLSTFGIHSLYWQEWWILLAVSGGPYWAFRCFY